MLCRNAKHTSANNGSNRRFSLTQNKPVSMPSINQRIVKTKTDASNSDSGIGSTVPNGMAVKTTIQSKPQKLTSCRIRLVCLYKEIYQAEVLRPWFSMIERLSRNFERYHRLARWRFTSLATKRPSRNFERYHRLARWRFTSQATKLFAEFRRMPRACTVVLTFHADCRWLRQYLGSGGKHHGTSPWHQDVLLNSRCQRSLWLVVAAVVTVIIAPHVHVIQNHTQKRSVNRLE